MAEPVYISVNLPNIITIILIVAIGWGLFAAGASLVRQNLPGGS
jgi:hypothetical protein